MIAVPFLLAALFAAEADLDRTAQLVIRQTNEYRQQHKLLPVKQNRQLQKAAQYFAEYLAREEKFDHEADDKTPAERAEEYDYDYCIVLENLAREPRGRGVESAELAKALVEGWVSSEHHRENLVDPDAMETGVAIARSEESGRYYAVQMFGRPKSQRIEFTISNDTKQEIKYELEGEEHALDPRVSRIHGTCRPAKLTLHLDDDHDESLTPKSGEQVTVVVKKEQLVVERRLEAKER